MQSGDEVSWSCISCLKDLHIGLAAKIFDEERQWRQHIGSGVGHRVDKMTGISALGSLPLIVWSHGPSSGHSTPCLGST